MNGKPLGDHRTIRSAGVLGLCGLLAGLAVASAAFPAVAMAGLAAKVGSEELQELPTELTVQASPQVTRVYASDGKTQIALMYDEFRSDVPLAKVSQNMQDAIVAAEDHKFFEHRGVDLKGVARAFVNNNQGGGKQGASTLTMQYVRMALAYSATDPQQVVDATNDTVQRKVSEMKYAVQVEKQLTKQEILERYLNMAPFGNGAYGISAASQVYFGKSPANLSVAESALLAGMVKAPTAFDPTTATGYPQAVDRRDYIIDNMRELKQITAAEATAAKKAKVPKTATRPSRGCVSVAKNHWGFFCDYFYRWWLSQSAFGETSYDRERLLKNGGYRIVTTLDLDAQSDARKEITDRQSDDNRNALMLAAVEPGTGAVRALAANRKYRIDDADDPRNELSSNPESASKGIRGTYPNTTNPIITGSADVPGYQAGSVFKMFTLVAALENGEELDTTINSPQRYKSGYLDSSSEGCDGYYCPSNASAGESGNFNMWTAFGRSVNTYFVPLQEQVGAEKVVDVAKRFGIQFRSADDSTRANDPDQAHEWGAFTLGVSMSTPLDIASAYATLAADGEYCAPTPIESITTADGTKIDAGQPDCTKATTKEVARKALDAARCPVGDQAQLGDCAGATAPQVRDVVGHPVFGKTGTTDNDKTAALVVGTRSLVVAGYLANPDWAGHTDRMSHSIVNPAVYETLADYMEGKPEEEFPTP
ncbi:membrane peptidoglycan carboxypeptidase [Actinoplanes campanulatus]|uniref:Membrane peptidoglycan carboxypeptidase n=1 Tax=Actinoplanes campanulatus TaxID=113559 RepID=A0A7W5ASG6_9ACTN|nr:membrane peptidoglycan carboxypeptidase [Actinoplanes campanulatus]GGN49592.1 penicillin-binding protein [Actinoplanes campanulatus]GID42250.1 penicillin-binding protein [Actinoplanes campanulatus]